MLDRDDQVAGAELLRDDADDLQTHPASAHAGVATGERGGSPTWISEPTTSAAARLRKSEPAKVRERDRAFGEGAGLGEPPREHGDREVARALEVGADHRVEVGQERAVLEVAVTWMRAG